MVCPAHVTLFSYTLCSSHSELTVLSGMDNIPSCLHVCVCNFLSLERLLCPPFTSGTPSQTLVHPSRLAHMLFPGSPLGRTCPSHPLYTLSLLLEFGPWPPAYPYQSTCCVALLLAICLSLPLDWELYEKQESVAVGNSGEVIE